MGYSALLMPCCALLLLLLGIRGAALAQTTCLDLSRSDINGMLLPIGCCLGVAANWLLPRCCCACNLPPILIIANNNHTCTIPQPCARACSFPSPTMELDTSEPQPPSWPFDRCGARVMVRILTCQELLQFCMTQLLVSAISVLALCTR